MHPLVDVITPGALAAGETFAEALARHPDRDVLLLAPGSAIDAPRLARLAATARNEASLATLCVFSATGPAEYRSAGAEHAIDARFAAENAGVNIEIPSAIPPCVYLTRRAIAECALDSPEPASLVAFSERATDAGLRHLLCGEVYVASPRSDEEMVRWQEAVDAQPRLAAAWAEFRSRAPATPLRRRVDLARLRASRLPRLLLVTHHWGGGVERHVRELARLLAADCEVLALRPGAGGTVQLQWLREGESLEAWFDVATQWDLLCQLLRALAIARVHIHHVHGLPHQALQLARMLGVPHDITLHDHYPICPQYHLADASGRYCREPDERGCNACLAARPSQWGLDIGAWRGLFGEVLRAADRVIVPSADLGNRVQRHFPDVQPQVWPHPEMRSEPRGLHRILVLGGMSAIKGMDLFEACVRDASARRLPLHFHVLGHVSRPLEVDAGAPVTLTGSYDDEHLATMVERERPDAFLFLSQVPESYSYTLTVAMQCGRPIVATQLGAFTERLRGYAGAALVPHEAPAKTVNDALLRLLEAQANPVPARTIAISAHRA